MNQKCTKGTVTFIGSSTEGVEIASALRDLLAGAVECVLWKDDVFLPSVTPIETLEKLLDTVDCAVLVATPDDVLTKRGVSAPVLRDNILFELGLFMARLGRRRTFLLQPLGSSLHLPSDLLGILMTTYCPPADGSAWSKVLETPAVTIRKAIDDATAEYSARMRRELALGLLAWTRDVQDIISRMQSLSLRVFFERERFEAFRAEIGEDLGRLARGHEQDARSLGLAADYDELIESVHRAIDTFPFPEELPVSKKGLLIAALDVLSGSSVEEQLTKLEKRYQTWWSEHGRRIRLASGAMQDALFEIARNGG